MKNNQKIQDSSCEWDRMSKSQKICFWIFLLCIISWGAPVYENMFGIKLPWVMTISGILGIISGIHSGAILMMIKGLGK